MMILVSRARHTPEMSCGRQSPKSVDPKVPELAESDGVMTPKKLTWVSCIPNIRDAQKPINMFFFRMGHEEQR